MEPGALMHGWPGLISAYTAVQAPLIATMVRARASWGRLLLAPVLGVPLTVASGVAMTLVAPALSGLGVAGGSLLQLSTGVAVSASLGYFSGRAMARGEASPPAGHLRGAIIAAPPRSPARGERGIAAARVRDSLQGRLTLAGVALAPEDEAKHFKLIGTTGTGKSTAIRELLAAALARGDRAVIADPDGGYLRHLYNAARGDVILNPFEPASVRWDLFAELAEQHDVDQLARSLIPDHEGPDRSWRGYARTFFSAVTEQARGAGVNDVKELYRLLMVAGTSELKTLVAGTPAQPFLEEHNGRMFDSIRSVTSSAVAALAYVARQPAGTQFSVRRWTRSAGSGESGQGGVLFIPYRAGQIAALRSVISAWTRLAIFEAMNAAEGDQRLWFVVDELDALGQIDGLKDALARLRKFGGRCVLGFQSIAQVSATYGAGEAQTLVENCGNTLILRCAGSEHGGTSQFASRLIGEREVVRTSVSRSHRPFELLPVVSRSENAAVETAVMASEIEQLPDLAGYLKVASRPQWMQVALRRPPPVREPTPREQQLGAADLARPEREGLGME